MPSKLRVPCSYQGGKQRVAPQIVEELLQSASGPETKFYDFCCGSGAITIELINRGIEPSRITMLDLSSWATFWATIGDGSFDMQFFNQQIEKIPQDKKLVKTHMVDLASRPIGNHEAELYPILQSASFGGKQISLENGQWKNAFFRDLWLPTPTSVRRSPANPMQPSPVELSRRVKALSTHMLGVHCVRSDISTTLDWNFEVDSVVYIDPPYKGTTGYGFAFDFDDYISQFTRTKSVKLFVSEGTSVSAKASKLSAVGAKGGISGVRIGRHEEWLSKFF